MNHSNCPQKSPGRKQIVRGMSLKNLKVLMEVLREVHGDAVDEMTLTEVQARHAELMEHLDEGRVLNGQEITDEQMEKLETFVDLGTTVRNAQREVFANSDGDKIA